ncbi:hemagglutinin, partial [Mycoplasmopsis synoviae]
YNGPAIVLDQAVPAVGTATNTSLNVTSNVTDEDFNAAFRGLVFTNRYVNPLMQSVINYVNKYDLKFRAMIVKNAINGHALTKDQNKKKLRPENLEDLLYNNNVF